MHYFAVGVETVRNKPFRIEILILIQQNAGLKQKI